MKRKPRAVARWRSEVGGMCLDCPKRFKSEHAAARHAAEMDHRVAWAVQECAAFGERWRRDLAEADQEEK